MGNSYSADHIAKDHIHTDITCDIEEPQQKYRFGTVSNRFLNFTYKYIDDVLSRDSSKILELIDLIYLCKLERFMGDIMTLLISTMGAVLNLFQI